MVNDTGVPAKITTANTAEINVQFLYLPSDKAARLLYRKSKILARLYEIVGRLMRSAFQS